jgi:hypothetical protein
MTEVVELVVRGTSPTTGSGGKAILNVFHYRYSSGGAGPDTASNLASQWLTSVWANIVSLLSIDYTGVEVDFRRLDDAEEQYGVGTTPGSGTQALPRMPIDLALVYLLRSKTRGKSFRGSKHFGPIAQAHVTKDEINAAGITAWSAVAGYLTTSVTTPGGQVYIPVIVSKTLSTLKTNPTTIIGADVTAALQNKTIGTMRGRREATVR